MLKLSRGVYFMPLLALFITTPISAGSHAVVINEIAWMGTAVSANDEWIELFNPADAPLTLDGWTLKTADGKIKIGLKEEIPARGFYLLERTDDNSVAGIPADSIYTGALSNQGGYLKLYDDSNNLIDEVNCSSGWFAGSNAAKLTMERINPAISGNELSNWRNSWDAGGSPKTQNSRAAAEIETPPENEEEPNIELLQSYPDGVLINEILPSPEGPDETEEWIELFNQNQFEVDLSGWKIKDSEGSVTVFTAPSGTKMSGSSFLVFSRPATKITMNNDSDRILLIQPNGKEADSVSYEKAGTGQSYSRTGNGWLWSSILTPGAPNRTAEEQVEKQGSPEKQDGSGKGELAAASQSFSDKAEAKKAGSFPVSLAALTISIFSGILILLLKKKLIHVGP
jgi:hypothetical protein